MTSLTLIILVLNSLWKVLRAVLHFGVEKSAERPWQENRRAPAPASKNLITRRNVHWRSFSQKMDRASGWPANCACSPKRAASDSKRNQLKIENEKYENENARQIAIGPSPFLATRLAASPSGSPQWRIQSRQRCCKRRKICKADILAENQKNSDRQRQTQTRADFIRFRRVAKPSQWRRNVSAFGSHTGSCGSDLAETLRRKSFLRRNGERPV